MTDNYKCEYNKGLMNWCCYNIENTEECHNCPQFDRQWKNRLFDSDHTYCHFYEKKKMKDCEGTHLDNKTGKYECKYSGNWWNCPHKTPNELYKKRSDQ